MICILRFLGAKISRKANTIVIDSSNIKTWEVPEYLMRKMRSSIILMGLYLEDLERLGFLSRRMRNWALSHRFAPKRSCANGC